MQHDDDDDDVGVAGARARSGRGHCLAAIVSWFRNTANEWMTR